MRARTSAGEVSVGYRFRSTLVISSVGLVVSSCRLRIGVSVNVGRRLRIVVSVSVSRRLRIVGVGFRLRIGISVSVGFRFHIVGVSIGSSEHELVGLHGFVSFER